EANARGAVGPRVSEGVEEVAIGILCKSLKRYRTSCGGANEALHLIPPRRWDRRVRMHGKAVHTRTPRTGELWRLTLVATACANAPDLLAGPLPTGDALLHGSRHGAGERGCVVAQRIIPGGHGGLHARLQISEPTQRTDDAMADFLQHVGHVGIAGRLALEKAGR